MENPSIVQPRRSARSSLAAAWYWVLARPIIGAVLVGMVMLGSHSVPAFLDDRKAGAAALLVGLVFLPVHVVTSRNHSDEGSHAHLGHLDALDRAVVLRAVRRGEDVGDRLSPSLIAFALSEIGAQPTLARRRLQAAAVVLGAGGLVLVLVQAQDLGSLAATAAVSVAVLAAGALSAVTWRAQSRRIRRRAQALRFAEGRAEQRRSRPIVYRGKPISKTGSWSDEPLWSVAQNERRALTS